MFIIQGGQLNCVEYFAGQASDQVDNGRYNIAKAKQKNKKRKVKKFISYRIAIQYLWKKN